MGAVDHVVSFATKAIELLQSTSVLFLIIYFLLFQILIFSAVRLLSSVSESILSP